MKTVLALVLVLAFSRLALAGEAGLTRTVQPLDGLGAGEIVLASVTCYDWDWISGLPTAIALITARNVPPRIHPGRGEDLNVASACGLVLDYTEDPSGRGVVTLDCRRLRVPARLGYPERQVVGATLECLRQVSGRELAGMELRVVLRPKGQEAIGRLFERFVGHPKDQPFEWQ